MSGCERSGDDLGLGSRMKTSEDDLEPRKSREDFGGGEGVGSRKSCDDFGDGEGLGDIVLFPI